ncbi:MAG: zinc carboxypeptidase [Elusimicrobia bacterium]|nr:zinc carboxypeptidase [Elusimicrobiota bacterium]
MKRARLGILAACITLPSLCHALPDRAFDQGETPAAAPDPMVPQAPGKPLDLPERFWITIAARTREERSRIVNLGISIEEVLGDRIGGIGTQEMLDALNREKIEHTAVSLRQRFGALDFPAEDRAYHNYARLQEELKAIAAAAPDLVSSFSIAKSLRGRDLICLRFNASERERAPSDKPGIAFMGTHHAREHLSTEVPLLLAKYLAENRQKPDIKRLLDSRDIYIIPMVNPDGVEYDIHDGNYHMHRKNMRDSGNGAVGVDLNRNYGFHWGEGGASSNPASDIYRGPSPFSEPETVAIKNFVESRANLRILLSYHTFSELILYPWGHTYDPIDEGPALAAYQSMAQAMGRMTGYKPEQSSELYIASGDTTDWAWGTRGIFSFTFELTPKSMWQGGFYPGAGAIATTFQNNIRPALYLMDLADNPLRARDADGAALPRTLGGAK